jgi:molybdopterin/thiamine biosynthesis adenylyltransferase
MLGALAQNAIPQELLDAPLARFGLLPRDILTLERPNGVEHFELAARDATANRDGAEIVLAGCGNVGSYLVGQLARVPGIGRVVLIDPDVYEANNFSGQDIRTSDFGRAKVTVQAERLGSLAPGIEVETHRASLESVPMGCFRGAIAIGAVDSRRARMDLNFRAHRAGIPWIDTAVHGAMMLCRIGVYSAGCETPCIECGWGEDDYARLEQRLPCAHALETPVDQPHIDADYR